MSLLLIMIPAALVAAVVERLPKPDRKIRRQWRRYDRRWIW